MSTVSITITAKELTALTAPVIPHASSDQTLPLLGGVLIRSAGAYVTAIATDRYKIGLQRITPNVEPDAGFRALVSPDALKQIARVFRADRYHDPLLRFERDGDRLSVTTADTIDYLGGGLTGATLTFLVDKTEEYPKLDHLIREALDAKPKDEAMALAANPRFLAMFAKGQPAHVPICISPTTHPNKPWFVRVGDDFIGLITPIRFVGETSAAPSWLDVLDAPEADEEAA